MTKLILLFILSIGLQVVGARFDKALKFHLESAMKESFAGTNGEAVKNLYDWYKEDFNRISITANEEKLRLKSFNEMVNVILNHHRRGEKAYTLELNEYADWTQDELGKLRGARVPQGKISETNWKSGDHFLTLDGKLSLIKSTVPTSHDFTTRVVKETNVPVILPIKNQGKCGSCYAFALISLLEFQYAVQLKSSKSLSEQQMIDCSTKDRGCSGGYFTNTFNYLQNNLWRVDSETSYPYKNVAGKCVFKGAEVRFGSLLYSKVKVNDAAAMQQALFNYGPLWATLFSGDNTTLTYMRISSEFMSYKSGIFQPSGCPTLVIATNHAVVIVGYGVDATTKVSYWKVRNSWGIGWGENGYFRIRLGVNMCGIESGVFYVAKSA